MCVNLTNTKHDAMQKKTYFDLAAPPLKSWAGSIPVYILNMNVVRLWIYQTRQLHQNYDIVIIFDPHTESGCVEYKMHHTSQVLIGIFEGDNYTWFMHNLLKY